MKNVLKTLCLVVVLVSSLNLKSNGAPVISQQPVGATITTKGSAQLFVGAEGTPPLSYQWLFSGTNLPGATNSEFYIRLATTNQSGLYAVQVSNSFGVVTSATARVSVLPPPANPKLVFTSVPAYGSTAPLQGRVTGIGNLGYYRVAVYIYVNGWWTKPYWASPLTVINSDGSWECNVTTGGSDQYATKLAAFVVPATYFPPSLGGQSQLPQELDENSFAKLIVPRAGRELRFSGYSWMVKQGYWGPGPNTFSDSTSNVWLDAQGQLHLRITARSGSWQCPEVICRDSLGYGIYQFTLGTPVDALDRNVVLGLFTWSDDPAYAYREMDIEFSHWGEAGAANNAQFVVQPYTLDQHRHMFAWPSGVSSSAHVLLWDENRAYFRSERGVNAWSTNAADLVHEWEFPFSDQVPPKGDETPRINLWLFNGVAPSDGREVEVVVKSFKFTAFGPPTIQGQPASQTVVPGADALFSVVAVGRSALSYQWQFGQASLPGATNATLLVRHSASTNAGSYTVVVSGLGGSVTSTVARLTISSAPPTILTQPLDSTVVAGRSGSFSVQAAGPTPLSYQWRFNGTNLVQQTNSNLVLASVSAGQAGSYTVVASNPIGSVTRRVARLTVYVPATVLIPPQSQVVMTGSNALLTVTAGGTPVLHYQWYWKGKPLSGATAAQLALTKVTIVKAGGYSVTVRNTWGTDTSGEAVLTVVSNRTSAQSAARSLDYLRQVMDVYHNRFPVYEDIGSGGNHFHALGRIPNETAPVGFDGSWTNNPHSGATAIRCTFTNTSSAAYGGWYFLNGLMPPGTTAPLPYFGTAEVPGTGDRVTRFSGLNLSGSVALTFWARGEHGGEMIEFFMGGVGRDPATGVTNEPFADSTARRPARGSVTRLSAQWQKFTINLAGLNLTNIMGGFGWVANAPSNPRGAVFYLDDIQYELSPDAQALRLNQPRFLRSFTTLPRQTDPFDSNVDDDLDFVLRNAAYTYDNALAALAFLAEGGSNGLQRARMIGDAFVYAGQHDRTFTNGQLRTAYAAGDIALPPGWDPTGQPGTVSAPGFYMEQPQRFYEVEQTSIDTGNNAWAMIGLLALYQRTNVPAYLDTARRIGDFILAQRQDTGLYQGFCGGVTDPEGPTPQPRTYASTEHNLDTYAAFERMYQVTGEAKWHKGALHAQAFIEAMWDDSRGGYLAGTIDPATRNEIAGQFPVDVQSWSVLAVPDTLTQHPAVLQCPDHFHALTCDGFTGVDFNDDRDGIWFEGTAHLAVARFLGGQATNAENLCIGLRAAQQLPAPYGDGAGLVAASHDGVSSGFGFKLFRRLHVGATAWNVFAQTKWNPYYQTSAIPSPRTLPVAGVSLGRTPEPAAETDIGRPVADTSSGQSRASSGDAQTPLPLATQIPLRLAISASASGPARLCIVGSAGSSFVVEVSNDLGQWVPLTVVTNFTGVLQTCDPDAAMHSRRFYRIAEPR